MKRMHWNLRGVDEETRQAVARAARRAGMSVPEWLAQTLAEGGPGTGPEPQADSPTLTEVTGSTTGQIRQLVNAVEGLAQRLATMDERARAEISGLADRLDEIDRHVSLVSDAGRSAGERARSLHGVSRMVEALSREIDNADERARFMIEGRPNQNAAAQPPTNVDRIGDAIRDLDERIAAIMGGANSASPPNEARAGRLDDIRHQLDALLSQPPTTPQPFLSEPPGHGPSFAIEQALRGLEERIDDARSRLARRDAAAEAATEATNSQIGRLEGRLADLAQQIAQAEEARRKPQQEAQLAAAIREIAAHQRSIDDRAETTAVRREQKALTTAITVLRDEIAVLAEDIGRVGRGGEDQHAGLMDLAARINDLASSLPADRDTLAAMYAEIESMRAMLSETAQQAALEDIAHRHDDLAAQLGHFMERSPERADLDALGAEVTSLRQMIEADDSPRMLARIEGRLSELGDAFAHSVIAQQAPDPALERLEERLHDLAARIDGLPTSAAAAQAAAIQSASDRFEDRLQAFAAHIGTVVDNVTRPQASVIAAHQRQLEDRLGDIVAQLGSIGGKTADRDSLDLLHERLSAISERLDGLDRRQTDPTQTLVALQVEVRALRGEIAGREAPPPLDLSYLEDQIRDLADQLEAVSADDSGGKGLAELEAKVAALSLNLAGNAPNAAALAKVEQRLDRLQSLLADTAEQSVAKARAEARKAVDDLVQMVSGSRGDTNLLRGLMHDLDSLRSAASDEPSAIRGPAVSDTLDKVVGHLGQIEEAETAQKGRANGTYDAVTSAFRRGAASPLAMLFRGRGRREGDHAAAPAAQAAPAPAPQPAKKSLDRRADFIAAARRAAQTAAREARNDERGAETPRIAMPSPPSAQAAAQARAPVPKAEVSARVSAALAAAITPQPPAPAPTAAPPAIEPEASTPDYAESEIGAQDRQPGAFARISQAIRSRRRPLLLAAAAIVLAIGALQVFGKVGGGASLPAPQTASVASLSPSGKDTSRLTGVRVVGSFPVPGSTSQPVAAAEPAAEPVTAAAPQPAAPTSGAKPDADIAFATPETVAGRFSSVPTAPPAGTFTSPAAATADVPAATANSGADADIPSTPTLVSAPAIPTDLDPRIGSTALLQAAATGDPAAAFEIATRFAEGARVPKNLAKAADWYRRAADGGVAVAQYRLASLYERGQGLQKDLTGAVNWYQRAADQGNVNAMHNLAVLMSEGVDGSPDHEKALQWFLAAADYGVRDSQYNLGVIYARGLGTAPDLPESYKWFAIAAAQGDPDAAARRDEVAEVLGTDGVAKARAIVSAWHVKPAIAEANAVASPKGGWDSPDVTVASADREALVKKIQTLLADAGYDPGPPDGVAGPKTVEAVRAYQRTVGAPETGEIDNTLVASLFGDR